MQVTVRKPPFFRCFFLVIVPPLVCYYVADPPVHVIHSLNCARFKRQPLSLSLRPIAQDRELLLSSVAHASEYNRNSRGECHAERSRHCIDLVSPWYCHCMTLPS